GGETAELGVVGDRRPAVGGRRPGQRRQDQGRREPDQAGPRRRDSAAAHHGSSIVSRLCVPSALTRIRAWPPSSFDLCTTPLRVSMVSYGSPALPPTGVVMG